MFLSYIRNNIWFDAFKGHEDVVARFSRQPYFGYQYDRISLIVKTV